MAAKFDDVLALLKKSVKSLYFLALPIAYLAGQAYHEGYLKQLKIEPGLLPLGVSETYTHAFIGSIGVFSLFLDFVGHSFSTHPWVATAVTLLFLLSIGALLHTHQRRTPPAAPSAIPVLALRTTKFSKFIGAIKDFADSVLVAAVLIYGFFAFLIFFLLFAFVVIKAFVYAGESGAKKDADISFRESATAYVRRGANSLEEKYQIVECTSQFCALYSQDKKGVVVPSSSIVWIDHGSASKESK